MKTRCKTQSPQSAHAAAGVLGVCGHVLCSSLKEAHILTFNNTTAGTSRHKRIENFCNCLLLLIDNNTQLLFIRYMVYVRVGVCVCGGCSLHLFTIS